MKFDETINKILSEKVRIKDPTISDKPQLYKIVMNDDSDSRSWIITVNDLEEAKKLFMKKFGNFISIRIKKPTDKDYKEVKSIKEIKNEI